LQEDEDDRNFSDTDRNEEFESNSCDEEISQRTVRSAHDSGTYSSAIDHAMYVFTESMNETGKKEGNSEHGNVLEKLDLKSKSYQVVRSAGNVECAETQRPRPLSHDITDVSTTEVVEVDASLQALVAPKPRAGNDAAVQESSVSHLDRGIKFSESEMLVNDACGRDADLESSQRLKHLAKQTDSERPSELNNSASLLFENIDESLTGFADSSTLNETISSGATCLWQSCVESEVRIAEQLNEESDEGFDYEEDNTRQRITDTTEIYEQVKPSQLTTQEEVVQLSISVEDKNINNFQQVSQPADNAPATVFAERQLGMAIRNEETWEAGQHEERKNADAAKSIKNLPSTGQVRVSGEGLNFAEMKSAEEKKFLSRISRSNSFPEDKAFLQPETACQLFEKAHSSLSMEPRSMLAHGTKEVESTFNREESVLVLSHVAASILDVPEESERLLDTQRNVWIPDDVLRVTDVTDLLSFDQTLPEFSTSESLNEEMHAGQFPEEKAGTESFLATGNFEAAVESVRSVECDARSVGVGSSEERLESRGFSEAGDKAPVHLAPAANVFESRSCDIQFNDSRENTAFEFKSEAMDVYCTDNEEPTVQDQVLNSENLDVDRNFGVLEACENVATSQQPTLAEAKYLQKPAKPETSFSAEFWSIETLQTGNETNELDFIEKQSVSEVDSIETVMKSECCNSTVLPCGSEGTDIGSAMTQLGDYKSGELLLLQSAEHDYSEALNRGSLSLNLAATAEGSESSLPQHLNPNGLSGGVEQVYDKGSEVTGAVERLLERHIPESAPRNEQTSYGSSSDADCETIVTSCFTDAETQRDVTRSSSLFDSRQSEKVVECSGSPLTDKNTDCSFASFLKSAAKALDADKIEAAGSEEEADIGGMQVRDDTEGSAVGICDEGSLTTHFQIPASTFEQMELSGKFADNDNYSELRITGYEMNAEQGKDTIVICTPPVPTDYGEDDFGGLTSEMDEENTPLCILHVSETLDCDLSNGSGCRVKSTSTEDAGYENAAGRLRPGLLSKDSKPPYNASNVACDPMTHFDESATSRLQTALDEREGFFSPAKVQSEVDVSQPLESGDNLTEEKRLSQKRHSVDFSTREHVHQTYDKSQDGNDEILDKTVLSKRLSDIFNSELSPPFNAGACVKMSDLTDANPQADDITTKTCNDTESFEVHFQSLADVVSEVESNQASQCFPKSFSPTQFPRQQEHAQEKDDAENYVELILPIVDATESGNLNISCNKHATIANEMSSLTSSKQSGDADESISAYMQLQVGDIISDPELTSSQTTPDVIDSSEAVNNIILQENRTGHLLVDHDLQNVASKSIEKQSQVMDELRETTEDDVPVEQIFVGQLKSMVEQPETKHEENIGSEVNEEPFQHPEQPLESLVDHLKSADQMPRNDKTARVETDGLKLTHNQETSLEENAVEESIVSHLKVSAHSASCEQSCFKPTLIHIERGELEKKAIKTVDKGDDLVGHLQTVSESTNNAVSGDTDSCSECVDKQGQLLKFSRSGSNISENLVTHLKSAACKLCCENDDVTTLPKFASDEKVSEIYDCNNKEDLAARKDQSNVLAFGDVKNVVLTPESRNSDEPQTVPRSQRLFDGENDLILHLRSESARLESRQESFEHEVEHALENDYDWNDDLITHLQSSVQDHGLLRLDNGSRFSEIFAQAQQHSEEQAEDVACENGGRNDLGQAKSVASYAETANVGDSIHERNDRKSDNLVLATTEIRKSSEDLIVNFQTLSEVTTGVDSISDADKHLCESHLLQLLHPKKAVDENEVEETSVKVNFPEEEATRSKNSTTALDKNATSMEKINSSVHQKKFGMNEILAVRLDSQVSDTGYPQSASTHLEAISSSEPLDNLNLQGNLTEHLQSAAWLAVDDAQTLCFNSLATQPRVSHEPCCNSADSFGCEESLTTHLQSVIFEQQELENDTCSGLEFNGKLIQKSEAQTIGFDDEENLSRLEVQSPESEETTCINEADGMKLALSNETSFSEHDNRESIVSHLQSAAQTFNHEQSSFEPNRPQYRSLEATELEKEQLNSIAENDDLIGHLQSVYEFTNNAESDTTGPQDTWNDEQRLGLLQPPEPMKRDSNSSENLVTYLSASASTCSEDKDSVSKNACNDKVATVADFDKDDLVTHLQSSAGTLDNVETVLFSLGTNDCDKQNTLDEVNIPFSVDENDLASHLQSLAASAETSMVPVDNEAEKQTSDELNQQYFSNALNQDEFAGYSCVASSSEEGEIELQVLESDHGCTNDLIAHMRSSIQTQGLVRSNSASARQEAIAEIQDPGSQTAETFVGCESITTDLQSLNLHVEALGQVLPSASTGLTGFHDDEINLAAYFQSASSDSGDISYCQERLSCDNRWWRKQSNCDNLGNLISSYFSVQSTDNHEGKSHETEPSLVSDQNSTACDGAENKVSAEGSNASEHVMHSVKVSTQLHLHDEEALSMHLQSAVQGHKTANDFSDDSDCDAHVFGQLHTDVPGSGLNKQAINVANLQSPTEDTTEGEMTSTSPLGNVTETDAQHLGCHTVLSDEKFLSHLKFIAESFACDELGEDSTQRKSDSKQSEHVSETDVQNVGGKQDSHSELSTIRVSTANFNMVFDGYEVCETSTSPAKATNKEVNLAAQLQSLAARVCSVENESNLDRTADQSDTLQEKQSLQSKYENEANSAFQLQSAEKEKLTSSISEEAYQAESWKSPEVSIKEEKEEVDIDHVTALSKDKLLTSRKIPGVLTEPGSSETPDISETATHSFLGEENLVTHLQQLSAQELDSVKHSNEHHCSTFDEKHTNCFQFSARQHVALLEGEGKAHLDKEVDGTNEGDLDTNSDFTDKMSSRTEREIACYIEPQVELTTDKELKTEGSTGSDQQAELQEHNDDHAVEEGIERFPEASESRASLSATKSEQGHLNQETDLQEQQHADNSSFQRSSISSEKQNQSSYVDVEVTCEMSGTPVHTSETMDPIQKPTERAHCTLKASLQTTDENSDNILDTKLGQKRAVTFETTETEQSHDGETER